MNAETKMQPFFNGFQCNLSTLKYCSRIVQGTQLKCPPRWRANGQSNFFNYHELRFWLIPCQHYVVMKLWTWQYT